MDLQISNPRQFRPMKYCDWSNQLLWPWTIIWGTDSYDSLRLFFLAEVRMAAWVKVILSVCLDLRIDSAWGAIAVTARRPSDAPWSNHQSISLDRSPLLCAIRYSAWNLLLCQQVHVSCWLFVRVSSSVPYTQRHWEHMRGKQSWKGEAQSMYLYLVTCSSGNYCQSILAVYASPTAITWHVRTRSWFKFFRLCLCQATMSPSQDCEHLSTHCLSWFL